MLAQIVAGILLLDTTSSLAFGHVHSHSQRRGRSTEPHLIKYGRGVNDTTWLSVAALDRLHDALHSATHSSLVSLKSDPAFAGVDAQALDALTAPRFGCGPGIIDLSDAGQTTAKFVPPGSKFAAAEPFPAPNAANFPELAQMFEQVNADGLEDTISTLSTNFTTRHYLSDIARESSLWIQERFASIVGDDNVVLVENDKFDQPNVVGAIPAAEGSTNEEIVVIGAHLDSINQFGGSPAAPGADDDASGISILVQVLEILQASGFRGQRRIEVHAYGGEEGGLLGSISTAAKYAADGKVVRAMLQMDMVGYQPADAPIITMLDDDDIDAGLRTFVKSILAEYVPEADFRTAKCNYACSDHYSFIEHGWPAGSINEAGPEVGLNPFYHSGNDTIDKLNMQHGGVFVKAALAFAVEASERADGASETTTTNIPVPTVTEVPVPSETSPTISVPEPTESDTDDIPEPSDSETEDIPEPTDAPEPTDSQTEDIPDNTNAPEPTDSESEDIPEPTDGETGDLPFPTDGEDGEGFPFPTPTLPDDGPTTPTWSWPIPLETLIDILFPDWDWPSPSNPVQSHGRPHEQ